jgi:hypothetical protein
MGGVCSAEGRSLLCAVPKGVRCVCESESESERGNERRRSATHAACT